MATHYLFGKFRNQSTSNVRWEFGREMEYGLREWMISENGGVFHWGILLEGASVNQVNMGIDRSTEVVMSLILPDPAHLNSNPLVIDCQRSEVAEQLIERIFRLEQENRKLKERLGDG